VNEPPSEQDLFHSVEEGFLKVVGKDTEGNTLFAVTEAGEARVEAMIDSVLEGAAVSFANQLDLPVQIAYDLLLMRAARLHHASDEPS